MCETVTVNLATNTPLIGTMLCRCRTTQTGAGVIGITQTWAGAIGITQTWTGAIGITQTWAGVIGITQT